MGTVTTYSRVILYGHRPRSIRKRLVRLRPKRYDLTYVFEGYFRAFQSLGFETLWLEEGSRVESSLLSGALVLTEDQVDDQLTKARGAHYVVHSSDGSKYQDCGGRLLHLRNFVTDLLDGTSYDFPGGVVERINSVTYVDAANSVLYQPWATDLLPEEITSTDVVPFSPDRRVVTYVGTIDHDNIRGHMAPFARSVARSGLELRLVTGLTPIQARNATRSSLVSVDIRGDWHLARGYIPCRLWKSLSYGMPVSSNSILLEKILGEYINFVKDEEVLFDSAQDWHSSLKLEQITEGVEFVRKSHTFVSRARAILQVLDQTT